MLILRWQPRDAGVFERPLDRSYTLDEVQREINQALEHQRVVNLLDHTGAPVRFDPQGCSRISVVPEDLLEFDA